MFPNVLMFQPEAARALLQYRIQTLGGALDNARNLGYEVRGLSTPPTGPLSGRGQGVLQAHSLHCTGGTTAWRGSGWGPSLPCTGAASAQREPAMWPRQGAGSGHSEPAAPPGHPGKGCPHPRPL